MNVALTGQAVWKQHFPGALIVMALTFLVFNTLQWSSLVSPAVWPYGTSFVTAFAYLVSQGLEVKAAIFVSVFASILVLMVVFIKVRPLLKTAMSPAYKWDTIGICTIFVGAFVALPLLAAWAFADIVVTNPHVYINTLLPCIVGGIYFAGKTCAATQFAEARTRATESVNSEPVTE